MDMKDWIGYFSSRFLNRRWEMAFLLFSGIVVVYILRVNISVAVQEMRDELNWSETQKGLVLSSFYWGYAIGQVPSSRLIQKYGGKIVFGLSVLLTSVFTLFVPLAARTSFGFLLFIRCLVGLCESASFPALFHFFPIWIPVEEKTFMIPAIISGMYMGEIFGFSLSGAMTNSNVTIGRLLLGGWPSVFYIFGFVGILWFPYWYYNAYENPNIHPKISSEEIELINKGKENQEAKLPSKLEEPVNSPMIMELSKFPATDTTQTSSLSIVDTDIPQSISSNIDKQELINRTPWKYFLTHPVSLTLLANSWTYGYIGFFLLSEMPSFLTDELGFDLTSAGILCIFPYFALFLSSLIFGIIFEYLEKKYSWTTDNVRQTAEWTAFLGSSLGLVICGFMPNKYAAYCFMIISQLFMGAVQSGLSCSYSDVSPTYSSVLNSIGNMVSAIAGIVAPLLTAGILEEYPGIDGWRILFFLILGMSGVSLLLWSIWQTAEIIPFLNNPI